MISIFISSAYCLKKQECVNTSLLLKILGTINSKTWPLWNVFVMFFWLHNSSFQHCLRSSSFFIPYFISYFSTIILIFWSSSFLFLLYFSSLLLIKQFFKGKKTYLCCKWNSLIKCIYCVIYFEKAIFYLIPFLSYFDMNYSFYQGVLNIWKLQRTKKWTCIIIFHLLNNYVLFVLLQSYLTIS